MLPSVNPKQETPVTLSITPMRTAGSPTVAITESAHPVESVTIMICPAA